MAEQYGLDDFIAELGAWTSKPLPPKEVLQALGPGFRKLLNNRTFLDEKLEELGAKGDEACLYEDPQSRFVVLARGLHEGKSHAGSPHDHGPLWALYGIYRGSARFQRYEPDNTNRAGSFPGLRMISERPAEAGDFDAIEPANMHLPVFPDGRNSIIVVYNGALDSVVRRGYLRDIQQPVKFQGQFPSHQNRVDEPL